MPIERAAPEAPSVLDFVGEVALVSVVMPAYNSADYIGLALESVLAQDYPAMEIIVIDDGSSDETCSVVASYGPRVRLLTQANQGSGAARNLGIREARGEFIAFLDADDYWWPHKISTQMSALRSSGHRLAYSRFRWWRPDADGHFPEPALAFAADGPSPLSEGKIVSGHPYPELLLDCIVWTSTVLVDKAALERVGLFDTTLRKGQDYDLWLRLSREVSMLGQDLATALYRIHASSITGSLKPTNYEYVILSRAVELWGEAGPDGRLPPPGLVSRRLARSSLNHGAAHLRRGDPDIAAASIRLAIKHSRINAKLALMWLAAWIRSVLGRWRS